MCRRRPISVSLGLTLTSRASPTAFYVYSSIIVANVPQVAIRNGLPQCAETAGYDSCGLPNRRNLYLEYWFAWKSLKSYSRAMPAYGTTQISFSTPFVYIPLQSEYATLAANVGYVPRALMDWIAQNPAYVAQYPGLATCVPNGPPLTTRGPPLIKPLVFAEARVLTTSSIFTTTVADCFHPGFCPQAAKPAATAEGITAANTAIPDDVKKGFPLAGTPPARITPAEPALQVQQNQQATPAASSDLAAASPANRSPAVEVGVGESPTDTSSNLNNGPPADESPGKNPESPASNPHAPPGAAAGLGQGSVDSPFNPDKLSPEQLSRVHQALQTGNENPSPFDVSPQTIGLGFMIANAIGMGPLTMRATAVGAVPSEAPAGPTSYAVSPAPSASAIVVNGVMSAQPNGGGANLESSPVVNINSQPTTLSVVPALVFDGQTVTPGAPAVTIGGTKISLAPSASQIVVAGSTMPLSPGQTPVVTIGSQAVTASAAPQYMLGTHTLVPSSPAITVSGTLISSAAGGSAIIISGSTEVLQSSKDALRLLTVGSQTYSADSNARYVIDGQTSGPGAPAITISETLNSLARGISDVVLGGSTESLHRTTDVSLPLIIIGSQTYMANANGAYVTAGQTLVPGQPAIVVTETMGGASPTAHIVDGQVFTPNPTAFSIDGTTISAGGPGITISGTPISLEASGVLDIGNQPVSLTPSNATAQPSVLRFAGGASRGRGPWWPLGVVVSSIVFVVL